MELLIKIVGAVGLVIGLAVILHSDDSFDTPDAILASGWLIASALLLGS